MLVRWVAQHAVTAVLFLLGEVDMPTAFKKFRLRRPTLVEIVVMFAIGALMLPMLFAHFQTQTRCAIEKRIATWQPGPDDRRLPRTPDLRPNMDITGGWLVEKHRSRTRLTISHIAGNDDRVEFTTRGCVGEYSDTRLATFQGAALLLEKPVSEYAGNTYDRLYAIEHDGSSYLISAATAGDYDKSFPKDDVFCREAGKSAEPNR